MYNSGNHWYTDKMIEIYGFTKIIDIYLFANYGPMGNIRTFQSPYIFQCSATRARLGQVTEFGAPLPPKIQIQPIKKRHIYGPHTEWLVGKSQLCVANREIYIIIFLLRALQYSSMCHSTKRQIKKLLQNPNPLRYTIYTWVFG